MNSQRKLAHRTSPIFILHSTFSKLEFNTQLLCRFNCIYATNFAQWWNCKHSYDTKLNEVSRITFDCWGGRKVGLGLGYSQ